MIKCSRILGLYRQEDVEVRNFCNVNHINCGFSLTETANILYFVDDFREKLKVSIVKEKIIISARFIFLLKSIKDTTPKLLLGYRRPKPE